MINKMKKIILKLVLIIIFLFFPFFNFTNHAVAQYCASFEGSDRQSTYSFYRYTQDFYIDPVDNRCIPLTTYSPRRYTSEDLGYISGSCTTYPDWRQCGGSGECGVIISTKRISYTNNNADHICEAHVYSGLSEDDACFCDSNGSSNPPSGGGGGSCIPTSCPSSYECGSVSNSCGGSVNCGTCGGSQVCGGNNGHTCIQRWKCNENGNGNCIKAKCDPGDPNCYSGSLNNSTCGGTNCNGAISGTVRLPNGNVYPGRAVLRKNVNASNWQASDITGGSGGYSFGNLNYYSDHDIKLVRSNELPVGFGVSANQAVDVCAYEMNSTDNTPWVKDGVQVPKGNVNFNLDEKLYNINPQALWDPEADGINNGDYINDAVTFTTNPGGRSCQATPASRGGCTIQNNPTDPGGRNYNITLSGLPTGDIMYSNNPLSRTIVCGNVGVNFAIAKGYQIGGDIFRDLNANGRKNTSISEDNYTRSTTVTLQGLGNRSNIIRTQTVTDGSYLFSNLFRGQYRIRIDDSAFDPVGYAFTTPKTYTVTVAPGAICTRDATSLENICVTAAPWGGSIDRLNFGIAPIYSVSGRVFINKNIDKRYDPGIDTVMPNQQIALRQNNNNYPTGADYFPNPLFTSANPQNTQTTSPTGYSFTNILQGDYQLKYFWTPDIYQFFDADLPVATPPSTGPSFQLSLQRPPDCAGPNLAYSNCTVNGFTNLNFVLTEITQDPFMKTFGGDVRVKGNFSNKLPTGGFFSDDIPADTNPPTVRNGIIFSSSAIDVRPGKYNPRNWFVTDSGFNPPIKSGYSILSGSIKKSGNKATDVPCQSPCNLSKFNNPDKTSIYNLISASGTVNINGPFDVPAGKNYIFLVKDNLNINTDIRVEHGSTVTFAVGEKITIGGNVKVLQGIYATDGDFEFATLGTDPTGVFLDTQINVEGSIIVGNTLMRTRKLSNRASRDPEPEGTPTIVISYRPDFILNMPAVIRTALSKRIEVVPGN